MLTHLWKANVRDFVDIEALEGGSRDGETTDSNDDGKFLSQKFSLMSTSYSKGDNGFIDDDDDGDEELEPSQEDYAHCTCLKTYVHLI